MLPMQTDWPALPLNDWNETRATVHMWTQVVGKIALRHAAAENHSWGIAMQVTPRGLLTRTLHHGARPFSFEFDFVDHQLVLHVGDERSAVLDLEPMPVAEFYRIVMQICEDAALPVRIWTVPSELEHPVRFEDDVAHASYDRAAVERWRVALSHADRLFRRYRSGFVGKCSPVHFFWGAFDLAVTRFSGRPAPLREGPAFMVEAYTHEVISHGFWPGSEQFPEAAFYAYAVPEPEGLKTAAVRPDAAYYHSSLGEFLLPYEAVRRAPDPDRAVLDFMESTYAQAATLGRWDRAALEAGQVSG